MANHTGGGRPHGHPPTAIQCALAVVTAGLAVAAAMLALVGTAQANYIDALPDAETHPRSPLPVISHVQAAPASTPSAAKALCPTALPTTYSGTVRVDGQPAYFLYTTQPGDAVFAIAKAFAISPDYILWNNPDLIYDPNLVMIGEELLIPSVDGLIYRVKPGDTLSDIAALYQIDVETILAFAPNSLTSADNAIEGMVLILPGAVPPSSSHIWP